MIHTYKIDVRGDTEAMRLVADRGASIALDALLDGMWLWGGSPTATRDNGAVRLVLPIDDGCADWRELDRMIDRPCGAERAQEIVGEALAEALDLEEVEVVGGEVETDQ